jgi:NADPH:quinone reductase-like Zn-dependent oxidoreductase
VDKVVEIGGAGTIEQSVACTRIGGEVAVIGFVAEGGGGLTSNAILHRSLLMQGMVIGPRSNFEALLAAMKATDTRPMIDSVFPFEDFVAAYHHLESGTHFGKVVISIE